MFVMKNRYSIFIKTSSLLTQITYKHLMIRVGFHLVVIIVHLHIMRSIKSFIEIIIEASFSVALVKFVDGPILKLDFG